MWESSQRDARRVPIDERRAMIVEEVNLRSSIRVSDICERFRVSEVTARNDLDKLERGGKLRRTHGGAVSIARTITVSYPDQRLNINVEAKRAVAKRAAALVSNGDSLLVDTGTTTFEFVRFLSDKRDITIVTSDLSIASFADSNLPHADVLLLGGALRKNHRYMTGPITNRTLGDLYLDKAFLATDSFHPDHGFTTEFTGNADVKRLMVARARVKIMLMDASKVRCPCFVRFAGISDIDAVVIDEDPGGALAGAIAAAGASTELVIAGDRTTPGRRAAGAGSDEDGERGRQLTGHVGRTL
ncbi:DeoR/GlpR family DNA-binding transcription regulator [Collinsella vaginalis]|uniref:DeoR/GlpR family DNA-binding transcription regulator n=1 Tax=Collinsella vaginalis TaxID=1870987 RepID=UPI000A27078C|nr:DeoR/GlpR family DNA-binding transcription regulator [Collinsella vaginalis]